MSEPIHAHARLWQSKGLSTRAAYVLAWLFEHKIIADVSDIPTHQMDILRRPNCGRSTLRELIALAENQPPPPRKPPGRAKGVRLPAAQKVLIGASIRWRREHPNEGPPPWAKPAPTLSPVPTPPGQLPVTCLHRLECYRSGMCQGGAACPTPGWVL